MKIFSLINVNNKFYEISFPKNRYANTVNKSKMMADLVKYCYSFVLG